MLSFFTRPAVDRTEFPELKKVTCGSLSCDVLYGGMPKIEVVSKVEGMEKELYVEIVDGELRLIN